ncbi:MAG: HNH endonuclease [Deltaproteobacteria bacterium]|nr:HNH endonuclease [Deltaproteobacteria bacterium]
MEFEIKQVSQLTNEQLLFELGNLRKEERQTQARFLVHLGEMEERRLFAVEGYSAFTYLTQKLGYSEGSAYKRIVAARAVRRFPRLYYLLREGKITMTNISLIHSHLTEDNFYRLLPQVEGKSRLYVEKLIAALEPGENHFPREEASCHYVKEDRVNFKFMASEKLLQMINRARELLGHKYPNASFEQVFTEAMQFYLRKHDPLEKETKKLLVRHPIGKAISESHEGEVPNRQRGRHIPASLKDEVWKRDQGKCSYVSPNGHVCGERRFLEVDHIYPWAWGGSNVLENLRLLCRNHNRLMAEKYFASDKRRLAT